MKIKVKLDYVYISCDVMIDKKNAENQKIRKGYREYVCSK